MSEDLLEETICLGSTRFCKVSALLGARSRRFGAKQEGNAMYAMYYNGFEVLRRPKTCLEGEVSRNDRVYKVLCTVGT